MFIRIRAACFNLGIIEYEKAQKEKIIENRNQSYLIAKDYWMNVTKEMDSKIYSQIQVNLGSMYMDLEDYEKAEAFLKNITDDDPVMFNNRLCNLGSIKIKQKQYVEGYSIWANISFQNNRDSKEIFRSIMSWCWQDLNNGMEFIHKFYENTKSCMEIRNFQHELMYRISKCENFFVLMTLHDVLKNLISITNKLHVGHSSLAVYENSFAHYTRHAIALRVMDQEKSAFRLNSMHFMNDPTEGNLINDLLNIDVSKHYEDSKHLAFASCFSFNHNSLNQFRLYGKTDGRENSGVSLVFNKDFFQMDMNEITNIDASIARFGSMEMGGANPRLGNQKSNTSLLSDKFNESKDVCLYQEKKKRKIEQIEKQPLYRCVYIDTESSYLRVARRSEISFYRTIKNVQDANSSYSEYLLELNQIDQEINKSMSQLKLLIMLLKSDFKKYKLSCDKQEEALVLVNDILLPLRYLIKHVAFEEEEECRMIYITNMSDPKIQSDPEKKWLYVEYAEPVKDHIKKVYLGDGAKDYRPFFERALADKSKVKDSNNPFRI